MVGQCVLESVWFFGAKFNVIVWLWPATTGPHGCFATSPPAGVRRRMKRKQAETGGSG